MTDNPEPKKRCEHCGQVLRSAEARAKKSATLKANTANTARLAAGYAAYLERRGLCTSPDAVRKRLLRRLLKSGEPKPPHGLIGRPSASKGKKLSLETRAQFRAAHNTPEARARHAAAASGKTPTPETRAKISAKLSAMWQAKKAAKREERLDGGAP